MPKARRSAVASAVAIVLVAGSCSRSPHLSRSSAVRRATTTTSTSTPDLVTTSTTSDAAAISAAVEAHLQAEDQQLPSSGLPITPPTTHHGSSPGGHVAHTHTPRTRTTQPPKPPRSTTTTTVTPTTR